MSIIRTKLNLKQRREIVLRFKAGEVMSFLWLAFNLHDRTEVEQIIRDFMNGKFKLTPERKTP